MGNSANEYGKVFLNCAASYSIIFHIKKEANP